MSALRIVFMGTPEFAVPSLQELVEAGYDIAGVITAPDKPMGRGRKLGISAVKAYAQEQGLNILQPTNLKDPEFLEELKSLNANLQVVVAFRMLPEVVWQMPEHGTFNLHASLLPAYRGAAPIHWAIINGEKETGCTTFFLKHEIDTGSILFQEKETIHHDDTVGSLYERLMAKGGKLVLKTVQAIEKGDYTLKPQENAEQQPKAPKIFRETCQINWDQPAEAVYNFVRGLNPFPGAWTLLEGKEFKIHWAEVTEKSGKQAPGSIDTDNKTYLHVACQEGWVAIKTLQVKGKKKMEVDEFFRGNKLNA